MKEIKKWFVLKNMNNINTRDNLLFQYKLLVGSDIDSKYIAFWQKQIESGLQTIDDFVFDVVNSYEYKDKIITKFRQSYYDFINIKLSLSTIKDFQKTFCNKHVTDKDIFEYIIYLPSYIEKYSGIIQNVYYKTIGSNNSDLLNINHGDERKKMEENVIKNLQSYYLEKFRYLENYDIEMLADDMMKKDHDIDQNEKDEKIAKLKRERINKIQKENDLYKESLSKKIFTNIKNNEEKEKKGKRKEKDQKSNMERNQNQSNSKDNISILEKIDENKKHIEISPKKDNVSQNVQNSAFENSNMINNNPLFNIVIDGFIQMKYKERFDDALPNDSVNFIKECFYDPSKLFLKLKQIENLQSNIQNLEHVIVDLQKYKSILDEHDLIRKNKKNKNAIIIQLDKNNVETFESVYKRPMFIQEYFKYIIENEDENDHVDFQNIYKHFCENYNKTRSLLHDFTNINLSEYEYVKKYLYAVDDKEFYNKIIDSIVVSDEYKTEMYSKILNLYSSLFNEKLKDHDIEYVFIKIFDKKLYLDHEEITDILIELKRETDDIINHIFTQYTKVLKRDPDVYEIEEYVKEYRNSISTKTLQEIDGLTEKQLILSLEFHDILKDMIKSVIPNIKPRILFEHLKNILEKIEDETYESIEMKINNLAKTVEN